MLSFSIHQFSVHKGEFIAVQQDAERCREAMLLRVCDKQRVLLFAGRPQIDETAGLRELLIDGRIVRLQLVGQELTVMQHEVVVENY